MLHKSVVRPVWRSLSASRANFASLPDAASRSSFASHCAASYSANHCRNRANSRFGSFRTAPVISATRGHEESLHSAARSGNP